MSTASAMITTIDTAISAIVTGQVDSINVDGESFNALNLDSLRRLRKDYEAIVATENSVTNGTMLFGNSGLSAGSGK